MHKHIRAEHLKAKVTKSGEVKSDKLMPQNQQILVSVAALSNDLIKETPIAKSTAVDNVKITEGL